MYDYYIQQLFHILHTQSEQLSRMEQMLKEMRSEIDRLRQGSEKTIDRVEYNFDLLKIEKLEGTLNIGLMPKDGQSLDDITVNGQPPLELSQSGYSGSELYSNIYQNVSRYLEDTVPEQIERMIPEAHLVLGDEYAAVIIEDVRKQLGDRITVYLKQYQTNRETMNPQEVEQSIIKQMKSEIASAVEQHLLNLQRGKWHSNENDSRQ
ncbi:spore germination protein GerPC [Paenibacillus sp. p3-SID867]|uniref:spore germination protein GerPC n=1 Tax=Paenibacillus sp. p3-SID867 TaxID=2916363 RepID=UPI0021A7BF3C|nr:spore germination protein GerPC [Paenibacillus sp. p3-SID867]MCT1400757.1 spore germination protein GerPC [Paenibacillus sp. p3-SID867]